MVEAVAVSDAWVGTSERGGDPHSPKPQTVARPGVCGRCVLCVCECVGVCVCVCVLVCVCVSWRVRKCM